MNRKELCRGIKILAVVLTVVSDMLEHDSDSLRVVKGHLVR